MNVVIGLIIVGILCVVFPPLFFLLVCILVFNMLADFVSIGNRKYKNRNK